MSIFQRATAMRLLAIGWLSLAPALLAPASAVAQQSARIEGRVTAAQTGAPLEGVDVSIDGTALRTSTDQRGTFRLVGVPAGERTIRAELLGRMALARTVTVVAGAAAQVDLALADDPLNLPAMVVTATRDAAGRTEVPANIGVVGGADIRAARPHHSAEIVNRIPGVLNVDLGGEGSTVALRLPINYTANYGYLEDGVPIRSTGFFNHNALYEVNIPGADRVEVFKGPATALYGSDAIGGVFNSLTRAPAAAPEVELFMEGGQHGYKRVLGSASNTWGSSGLRADVNVMDFDGWRDGAHQERQTGTVRWDLALNSTSRLKTVVTGTVIDSPGDGGSDIPRADFDSTPERAYTPVAFRKVEALRWSTAYQRFGDRSSLDVTAYARHNRLNLLPYWQLTYDPQVWDSNNKSAGLLTKLRRDLGGAEVIVGVDADYSPGSNVEDEILPTTTPSFVFDSYTLGERQYDYDVTFYGISPYAQLEADLLPGLHASAGLRFDQLGYQYENHLGELQTGAHRRPASTDVSYSHLSPNAGLTYSITDDVNVYGAYRHGFRVPSQGQLFAQGSAPSTLDLEPARSNSFEAGLRGVAGTRLSFELSAYTMSVTNDIVSFFNTTTFTSEVSNAGETRHRGLEAGIGVAPVEKLLLEVAFAVNRSKYITWVTATNSDYGGNEMESAPDHIANTRLTFKPVEGSSVSLEWQRVGEYFTDPENQHTYGGYDLLSLYFTGPDVLGFSVVGRVSNLTDERYAVTASYNPFVPAALQDRYTPGMPRSVYLGLQYRWSR
jgi:outer membrane receptor protein involved in Fe transport